MEADEADLTNVVSFCEVDLAAEPALLLLELLDLGLVLALEQLAPVVDILELVDTALGRDARPQHRVARHVFAAELPGRHHQPVAALVFASRGRLEGRSVRSRHITFFWGLCFN